MQTKQNGPDGHIYKFVANRMVCAYTTSTNTFIIYLIDDYHTNCIEQHMCFNYFIVLRVRAEIALHRLKTVYQTQVFYSMSKYEADVKVQIVRAERIMIELKIN